MRFLKNVFSQLHSFVLWLLASCLFWGWIFTMVTDVPPAEKVTVYCDVPEIQDTAMAVALEEDMPEGLRMIKVHAFSYVMFDMETIDRGDIFILPASGIETYSGDLLPIDGEDGAQVYDPETGQGAALAYIQYADEDYYLFLGAGSVHLEDGLALEVAHRLLNLK